MPDGWNPSVVIQGKLYHQIGSVVPEPGHEPVFIQTYVYDTDFENASSQSKIAFFLICLHLLLTFKFKNNEAKFHFVAGRLKNALLPGNPTQQEMNTLQELFNTLEEKLRQCNPFIHDFVCLAQLPDTHDMQLYISADKKPAQEHARRYNAPQGLKEVAILIGDEYHPRDIVLHMHGGSLQRIHQTHRSYDALHYILLNPQGNDGWKLHIPHTNTNSNLHAPNLEDMSGLADDRSTKYVSCLQFYCFYLHDRDDFEKAFFYASRLFQEYIVMSYAKILSLNLKYLANNQKKLRCELYCHLADAVSAQDHQNPDSELHVGVKILPATHVGSPRYMHKNYQDTMCIVANTSSPHYFITMTTNPKWQEITSALLPGQQACDRPDLVSRVFNIKLDQLIDDIMNEHILVTVVGLSHVIEFQKRGLPHAHMLIIIKELDIVTTDNIDNIVCAELPQNAQLRQLVLENMIHTCTPDCKIPDSDKCKRHYPMNFSEHTYTDEKGKTHYRRRSPTHGGFTHDFHGRVIDNRCVVPYNPYLLLRYKCHMNVEICASIKACKYLYKYVYKGCDRAMSAAAPLETNKDEIQQYQDNKSIGACEACWRTYSLPTNSKKPAVMALALHLPNQQSVMYVEGAEAAALQHSKSPLLAYFHLNTVLPPNEPRHLYVETPKYYTYNKKNGIWTKRRNKQRYPTLGRIYTVHPKAGDVFYLRMLLHDEHSRGAKSFESLLIVNNVVHETYQAVCRALGKLDTNEEWAKVMEDAEFTQHPKVMRELFVVILTFNNPHDPLELFNRFAPSMAEDFAHR